MEPSEGEEEDGSVLQSSVFRGGFPPVIQFVCQAGTLRLPSSKERSFGARPSNLTQQISGRTLDDEWFSSYSAKENQGEQTCRGMLSLQHG